MKKEYTYSPNVKTLTIWGKNIQSLSDETFLKDIKDLNIEKADQIDIHFNLFPNVQKLIIESKNDYRLPNELIHLSKLKELITKCRLPENIHLFRSLDSLYIQELADAPEGIEMLPLKELIFSYYSDKLDPIPCPDFIFKLKSLEKLELRLAKLTSISDEINSMINLKSLDFGCSLSLITNFPDISNLANLKELIVRGENVIGQKKPPYILFKSVLNNIIKLPQLEILDISFWSTRTNSEWLIRDGKRNSIPDIFDSLPNLKELSLAYMNLDYLPKSIYSKKSLRKLYISNNCLPDDEVKNLIKCLPNTEIIGNELNRSRFK